MNIGRTLGFSSIGVYVRILTVSEIQKSQAFKNKQCSIKEQDMIVNTTRGLRKNNRIHFDA